MTVDNYINVKRLQFLIKWMIAHVIVDEVVRILKRKFKHGLWLYDRKSTIAFVVLKVTKLWKIMVSRRGKLDF